LYKLFYHIGRYVMLMGGIFRTPEKFSVYYRLTLSEAVSQANGSLMIVVIISTFIGAVSTLQTAYQLETGLLPDSIIGAVVAATTLLELAPTVMSFILAGRIGSNIASQIGTMRVTEQIDAIEVMGINPQGYLLIPRILAGIISFPVLVTIAAFLGILGGMVAGHLSGEVTATEYSQGLREYYDGFQVVVMYIKAVIFGFLITSVAAYQGFYTRGGALEVGEASTRAVVFGCLSMVIADYLVAQLLL
jgi:phospholipid/cholesterol/gamma-HCH transport system permease protein